MTKMTFDKEGFDKHGWTTPEKLKSRTMNEEWVCPGDWDVFCTQDGDPPGWYDRPKEYEAVDIVIKWTGVRYRVTIGVGNFEPEEIYKSETFTRYTNARKQFLAWKELAPAVMVWGKLKGFIE